MGNSWAYPVFTSTSAADACALARRLRALMPRPGPTVRLAAELRTAQDVRRTAGVLPNALYEAEGVPFDPERLSHEFRANTLPAAGSELEALLPVFVDVEVPAADEAAQSFVRALGTGPATVDWHGAWPDVPDLGLVASEAYEGVQAVFSSDDTDWERPAADHTVFVHLAKSGGLPRARWLAGRVGARVLKDPVRGW